MAPLASLRHHWRRQEFHPGLLGWLGNPVCLIRHRLRQAVAERAPGLTGRVLDFGCGAQPYREFFTGAKEYVGVDVEVSGHHHGRSKIDFFYDGKTLPFGPAEFDAVFASEVFEHVFNLPEILGELARVARPGATLLCSTPFLWGEHEQPHDFARYSSFGLTELLRRAGWEVVEIKRHGHAIEAVAQLASAYLESLLPKRPMALRFLICLFTTCPINVLALILGKLLPGRDTLFCGLVITARRVPTAS